MPCVKSVREPDAANPHVRFDERGEETGQLTRCYRASPRLYPIVIGRTWIPPFKHLSLNWPS